LFCQSGAGSTSSSHALLGIPVSLKSGSTRVRRRPDTSSDMHGYVSQNQFVICDGTG
jgi:hypothetical protein